MRSSSTLAALLLLTAATSAAPPPATALAYSPDGKRLAAGGRGVVTLIDPTSGEVTGTHGGQDGRVTAVAFAKSGTLAVASGEAGKAGVIRLYRPGKAEPTATLTGPKDVIYALAFSPDGTMLAAGGYDRLVRVWHLPSAGPPQLKHTLADHSDAVYALAFHPGGKLLATGAADRAVKVWDVATGARLYTLADATDWVYAVAWTPDGSKLAAGGVDRSLRVWAADATGGKLTGAAVAHERPLTRLFVTPDGQKFVTVGDDRAVKVWTAATLTEVSVFPTQPEAILAAALRPDGKQLAIGRFDGKVLLLDATTGAVQSTPLPAKPAVTAVSPAALVRGTPTKLTLTGTGLDRLTAVRATVPGVEVKLGPASGPDRREVTITAVTRLGPVGLVATSDTGNTKEVGISIDAFPAATESVRSDSARTAAVVPFPATVVGAIDRPGDVDYFAFTAKAGEAVGVRLSTALARPMFIPVLGVTDAAGRVLAEADGGRLAFTAPAAGRYALSVRDRSFRGGAGFAYRLHAGPLAVVTAPRPLGVPRGTTTAVRLAGVHLGSLQNKAVEVTVPADARIGSKVAVPLPPALAAEVDKVEVTVGEFPAVPIPPAGAVTLPKLPATADGVLAAPGAAHRITFHARKDSPIVVETEAARLGSPADTVIAVTDAAGVPVPRAVLRATAQVYVTFRDHDATKPGIRLEAWNELAVDDYLYSDGELLRIKALPPGPDDDCQFYQAGGKRVGHLGTTPTFHPVGGVMYKVEVHPPGRTFPSTGLPVITLPYRNDDGGADRDSHLIFDPPADGDYTVTVSDAAGAGGPGHGYRLTVRPPRPDFTLAITPTSPAVWAGGGIPLSVTATRIDGFAGPVALTFEGLPAGFHAPATRIEAGQLAAVVPLTAAAGAKVPADAAPWRVVGRAVSNGKELVHTAAVDAPTVRTGGDLTVMTNLADVVLRPGGETRVTVTIQRHNGFKGRVPLDLPGLPHGVRVPNIGLNGILITPDKTSREVIIVAEPWVKAAVVPFVVQAKSERKKTDHTAPPVVLRVTE